MTSVEVRNAPRQPTDNGHRWQRHYRDGVLVAVRCAGCLREPMEVLRVDFTHEPCRRADVQAVHTDVHTDTPGGK